MRVPVIALGLGDDPIRQRLGLSPYLNPRTQGSEPRLNPAIELGSQIVDNAVPVDVVALPDGAVVMREHLARVTLAVSCQMHRRRHLLTKPSL